MTDKTELTSGEQKVIGTLADKLIEATNQSASRRVEVFKRLAVFVEGVKLGLSTTPEVPAE